MLFTSFSTDEEEGLAHRPDVPEWQVSDSDNDDFADEDFEATAEQAAAAAEDTEGTTPSPLATCSSWPRSLTATPSPLP